MRPEKSVANNAPTLLSNNHLAAFSKSRNHLSLIVGHVIPASELDRQTVPVALRLRDVLVDALRCLVPANAKSGDLLNLFTTRDRVLLAGLAEGDTNIEISRRLHVSSSTVKQQASGIYRKLKVRNRAAAVLQARNIGLID